MNRAIRLTSSGLTLAGLLVLSGCGGDKNVVAVKGRILENNAALKTPEGLPPGTPTVVIGFHPLSDDNETGDPQYAVVDEDGTFDVPGPKGKGIPMGKYRISVKAAKSGAGGSIPKPPPAGAPGVGGPMGFQDRFNSAFSHERSPLIVEIDGPCELVIDVGGKGKVTKE